MKIAERPADIKARLAANTYFAECPILLEEDPDATTDQDAAHDKAFQHALNTKGVVIVVLEPYTSRLGQVKTAGISLRLHLPIAIVENKQVNRAAGGFGKAAVRIAEEVMAVLLDGYEMAEIPFGRPERVNGLTAYFLVAETVHVVRKRTTP